MKFLIVCLLAVMGLQAVSADAICNCRMGAVSRIVNGNATKNHIPWMVLIKHEGKPIGTGFMLRRDKVLTAASIVQDKFYNKLSVVAGVANLSKYSVIDDERAVSWKIVHPDFNAYRMDNGSDIAILDLAKPFDLKRGKIELACLDLDFVRVHKEQQMIATGYGVTSESESKPSNVARYALFDEVHGVSINRVIAGKPAVENATICDLDYGAPLHTTVSGLTKVIGIASYSEGSYDAEGNVRYCAEEAYFTKLSSVKKFIKDRVKDEHC